MQAKNKSKKFSTRGISKLETKDQIQQNSQSKNNESTFISITETIKVEKNSSQEENFKSKKEYKNPGLYSLVEENDKSLQNSMQNLRISIDSKDVISKELLEHKDVSWSSLKLSPKTIRILTELGYKFPSPVQYQSIPEIIAGSDVLVRAKNGSGKSLSFLIPIIEKINVEDNSLQAIVVAPTRELALQIARFARSLCKDLNIKSAPLIGGSNISDDIMRVSSGVQLLVGSPGRLCSILSKNLCKISNNPLIIFDEADKLLDSVHFEEIYNFLNLMPKKRQICLFSATFPCSTKSFMNTNLTNPKLISANTDYALPNLTQFYCITDNYTSLPCLKSLLLGLEIDQCIIYVNSINKCQMLARKITEMGLSCYFIHSQLTQDERNLIFHNFTKNNTKILISTDITTRGTDVQGVNVVINFELPLSSESYLHRMGRAGRFGRQGCCINIISEKQLQNVHLFASFVGSSVIPCFGDEFKKFCKN
jgi:ATP-dependent RNA helicase DDX6/DHH1